MNEEKTTTYNDHKQMIGCISLQAFLTLKSSANNFNALLECDLFRSDLMFF